MELDFERVWLPYLYLYGGGGLVFFGGLWMVLKSPAFNMKRRKDRRWLGILLFGYIWYAGMHGVSILAAISS